MTNNVFQLPSDADVHSEKDAAKAAVPVFASEEAKTLLLNVNTARAIVRTVVLAIGAQIDGSIDYLGGNHVQRWDPAVDEACTRLEVVRDLCLQTSCAPNLNWFTPLVLLEAIAAALWFCHSCDADERLDFEEADTALRAVIQSLDLLLEECREQGVLEMAFPTALVEGQ